MKNPKKHCALLATTAISQTAPRLRALPGLLGGERSVVSTRPEHWSKKATQTSPNVAGAWPTAGWRTTPSPQAGRMCPALLASTRTTQHQLAKEFIRQTKNLTLGAFYSVLDDGVAPRRLL